MGVAARDTERLPGRFEVVSDFEPAGDQPKAIEALSRGVLEGLRFQPCWASPAAARRLRWPR